MRLADLAGLRVAVWGYGREGRAALTTLRARFPAQHIVVFCSADEAAQLPPDAGVDAVVAAPDAARLREFDVVIKSPGISPYKPPLPEAESAGVRFVSGSALWFAENPQARTICVTGTKGKSTLSALIAHLLRALGVRTALAGNIGLPLLELLAPAAPPAWWVIELSSFQTRDFGGAPTLAVINNLYEEHLDWHGTRARYAADKLALAARAGTLLVNAAQPELLALTASHARRRTFGAADGWHVRDGAIRRGAERVLELADLPLPGEHNAQNVCAALAALEAVGVDARAAAAHVAKFRALPHRLQRLGERAGVAYVNDSIATTPYATIEALRSLAGRATTVLVGGFDRGVDWTPFVDHVRAQPPHAIVASGANGARIADALRPIAAPAFALRRVETLSQALDAARALTPPGGAILLSPGAPSFDQFADYAARGREFARLAGFDPSAIAQIDGLGIA